MQTNRRTSTMSQDDDTSASTSNTESKRRKITRVNNAGNVEKASSTKSSSRANELELCGTIERIILKNVFCHEHLDFSGFTCNINLLQGTNGSGKSSIVAAIIAGLGGSSRATDRGQNLKSIIQNGKSNASIEIHLKNRGPLAYKHDKFGDSVIVERKISASGASSYKIFDHDRTVVSTKKDDLNKILDAFSFQIDNPVLILSQERAKTFLSGTKPHDLFEFFMKATQLRQWKDDFNFKKARVQDVSNLVVNKEKNLPRLEKDVKEWEKKVQAISCLQERRNTLSHLRMEKAWAEVKEENEHLELLKEKQEKIDVNLGKVAAVITKFEEEKTELKDQRKSFDDKVVETSKHIQHWETELTNRSDVYKEAKLQLRKDTQERNALEREKLEKEQDVRILKEKLQKDNDEVTAKWQATMKALDEEKEKQMLASMNLQEALGREQTTIQELTRNLAEAEDDFQHLELQEKAFRSRTDALERELKAMLQGGKDDLTVFGHFMPTLVREVDNANRRGGVFVDKPIGPLGSYIKVRDPAWVHIVENITRGLLPAFIVSCSSDMKQLSRIFDRIIPKGTFRPQIIVSKFRERVHDTSRFETFCPPFFSMWSILEVENVQVANALLDQLQVESILLVPTADEAANLLTEKQNVPKNCQKAMTLHGDTYYPDPNYKVYSGKGEKRVRFLQVSIEERIRDLRLNYESTRTESENCRMETLEQSKAVQQIKRAKAGSVRKLTLLQNELNVVKRKIQELISSAPPPPPDVAQLRSELEENEKLKEDIENKIHQLNENIAAIKTEVEEKGELLKVAQKECENIRSIIQDHESNTSRIDEQLLRKQKEIKAMENKQVHLVELGEQNQRQMDEKEALIKAKEEEILQVYPERIEPEKSKEELERAYSALKKAIEQEEAKHGNLEQISSTWRLKKQKYENIKKEVKADRAFVLQWNDTLASREQKFRLVKKMFSVFLGSAFQNLIQMRKLVGIAKIDYKAETLKIMMRKDTSDQSHQLQSLQMMSGGERSFATVSFILALWDIASSPVKIMDEFEIFMDVVSRKQCMSMIIEAAKPNQQYILVSPLENKEKSSKLTIFRMPEPGRKKQRPSLEDVSEEM